MLKFAFEKSFSEDSGGGGRQSNVHLVPYLLHMALYVLNTTRSVAREEKNITNFLKAPQTKWVESSYEVEGPLYWTVMAVLLLGKEGWRESRVQVLQRVMLLAHARHVMPAGGNNLSEKAVKEYNCYKPYLLFYAFADGLVNTMFKKVSMEAGGQWSVTLAEYIRHNDAHLLEQGDRMLHNLETEVTPCESFDEYCDVLGLLEQIPNPANFLSDILTSLPQNS
jgi:E3 ubiquitin-protein ligase UBR4